MSRVPMEPIAYHGALENPFGRSRINRSVRDLVDDAQREMGNMAVAASFSAAPQKHLLNTDRSTAEKIAKSPFSAYIGSILTVTQGRNGQAPQFGQLAQMSMQPHIEYMRLLASQFSNTTDVALRELGYDDEQVHQLRSDRRRSQAQRIIDLFRGAGPRAPRAR